MPPSLFSDISEGIFGRLNYYTDQQKKQDDEKRGQVLNLLTGLMDKVEPESQGVLLGHIGDVMKLKGKERGLWDRLTGRNADATETALGSKLKDTLSQFGGPFHEQNIEQPSRGTSSVATAGGPMQLPNEIAPSLPTTTAREPGRMYLRDPRQERLNEIETRYQQQAEGLNARMYEQARLRSEEREESKKQDLLNRKQITEYQTQIKDHADVRQLASRMQMQPQYKNVPLPELLGMAADSLDQERGLKLGTMRERIALMKDKGAEARANAQSLQSGEGISAPVARKESADRALQQELQAVHGPYAQAFEEIKIKRPRLEATYAELEKIAQSKGIQFNRETGEFSAGPGQDSKKLLAEFASEGLRATAKKLSTEISDAETRQARGHSSLTSGYGEYIDRDPNSGFLNLKAPYSAPRKQGAEMPPPTTAPGGGARSPRAQQPKTIDHPAPPQKGAPPPLTMNMGPVQRTPDRFVSEDQGPNMIGGSKVAMVGGNPLRVGESFVSNGRLYMVEEVLPVDQSKQMGGTRRYKLKLVSTGQ